MKKKRNILVSDRESVCARCCQESRILGSVSSLENIFLKLGCISSNLTVSANTTSISKYSHAVSLNYK